MEFLYADDAFSIFIFVVVMIVLFILLLNLLMGLITLIMNSEQVYIIKGMIPGNVSKTIQVNPNIKESIPIDRSDNKSGIEFSWSVWINVNDMTISNSDYVHVFNKGEQSFSEDGLNKPNNSPGVYLKYNNGTDNGTTSGSGNCELHVLMNTYNTGAAEHIVVPNFPVAKWVSVIIRMTNKDFAVYVNGTLAKQRRLLNVPHQNYGTVNIGANGGFNGNISDLIYYKYALSPGKIVAINKRGPNLKLNASAASLSYGKNYLSNQWYSDNLQ
jgi:hypothetical protein